jgi:hypothetical protein
MSLAIVVTTSIEMLGRIPAARNRKAGGNPCLICISTSGAIDPAPPLSAIDFYS